LRIFPVVLFLPPSSALISFSALCSGLPSTYCLPFVSQSCMLRKEHRLGGVPACSSLSVNMHTNRIFSLSVRANSSVVTEYTAYIFSAILSVSLS
jgi:hypothetical protein